MAAADLVVTGTILTVDEARPTADREAWRTDEREKPGFASAFMRSDSAGGRAAAQAGAFLRGFAPPGGPACP